MRAQDEPDVQGSGRTYIRGEAGETRNLLAAVEAGQ
jgi:hypothetical protein